MIRRLQQRLERLRELSSRSPDRQPASGQLPQPRMELRDLVSEAAAGLMARPARVGLTVLGTVIGVAALVATLGPLEDRRQPDRRAGSTQVAATDVVVTPVPAAQRSRRRRRERDPVGRRGAHEAAERRRGRRAPSAR